MSKQKIPKKFLIMYLQIQTVFLFSLYIFHLFVLPFASTRAFMIAFITEVERGRPCLVPTSGRKYSRLNMVHIEFCLCLQIPFIKRKKKPFLLIPNFLGGFLKSWEGIVFCQMLFLYIELIMIFSVLFFYVMNYVSIVKPTLHSRDKSHLIVMCYPVYTLLDLICSILHIKFIFFGLFSWGISVCNFVVVVIILFLGFHGNMTDWEVFPYFSISMVNLHKA